MYRRPASIIVLAVFGIVTGLFQLGFGILLQDGFSLSVGICYVGLSIALVSLKNWIRIVFISCSLIFILLEYIPVFIAAFTIDPFYGKGILFYLPAALFALCSIVYLGKSRVRKQFEGHLDSPEHNQYVHIFWKTYFCFLVFLLLPSVYFPMPKPLQHIDTIIAIVALTGLFGFAWQKKLMPISFWKIFSAAYPIWNICYEFFLQHIEPSEAVRYGSFSLFMVHVLALVKILPLMIALYLYAFNKEK